eukprot:417787-Hanusia_phi.AAC.1
MALRGRPEAARALTAGPPALLSDSGSEAQETVQLSEPERPVDRDSVLSPSQLKHDSRTGKPPVPSSPYRA